MRALVNLLVIIAVGFGIYGVVKGLPDGVSLEGEAFQVPGYNVTFLKDMTYVDQNDVRHSEQEIFDEAFRMIRNAHQYVLVDMFLFNDMLGTATSSYRQLSDELTDTLISKKTNEPDVNVIVITDPINELYGGYESKQFDRLRNAGIDLIVTDLLPLRDSNPIYSAFYRPYLRWLSPSLLAGRTKNPFDSRLPGPGLGSYAALFNFKANHRKVLLTDSGNTFSTLITSANPHDGSSAHTNTAIKITGSIWKDVLKSESTVAALSGASMPQPPETFLKNVYDAPGNTTVQLLTEGKIQKKIIEKIDALKAGESLDIAMFYLSDRSVITALKRADDRNVKIRILLDPNKDAFGRKKNGIPNRPVAAELLGSSRGNTEIRFCDTHGEQCHTKLLIFRAKDKESLIDGSANLTRRNLDDLNLETDVFVEGTGVQAIQDAENYFESVWNNTGGKKYSVEYDRYKDESKMIWFVYRIMEDLGTSSF